MRERQYRSERYSTVDIDIVQEKEKGTGVRDTVHLTEIQYRRRRYSTADRDRVHE